MSGKPEKIRDAEEFLEKIKMETGQAPDSPSPEKALKVVSRVLADRIDAGQYRQVKDALPADIQALVAA